MSAQAVGVDPAAPAGRSGADAHLLGRGEGTGADGGRATDPVTTRRDPARPDSSRDDSNRPGGARPAKLPRRSGVARDVPEDLEPAAATRAPDSLAAAEDIGVIKASHDDSGPGPRDPESHNGGRDGGADDNTPDTGMAGGGAGDYRGGTGGHSGGDGGGAGDGVAGLGGAGDDDSARAQQAYRELDPTTRQADTRYADPLGEVVDNAEDSARVDQFAEDLCGVYGLYRIQWDGYGEEQEVRLEGEIFSGETLISSVVWTVYRDDWTMAHDQGDLVADYAPLDSAGIALLQPASKEAVKALYWQLEDYWRSSGVDRIELTPSGAPGHDAYTAARRGFDWDPDPENLEVSLESIKSSALQLAPRVGTEARGILADMAERLDIFHSDVPELGELAALATPEEPDLGRQLLHNVNVRAVVHLVKYLRGDGPDEPPALSRRDVGPGGGAADVGGFGSSGVEPVDRGADPGQPGSHGDQRARGDDFAIISARSDPNPTDQGDSDRPNGSSPRDEPPSIDLPQPIQHIEDPNPAQPSPGPVGHAHADALAEPIAERGSGKDAPEGPPDNLESWRRDPLRLDFCGQISIDANMASTTGQRSFVFYENTIDDDAREFMGRSQCHQLAAALHGLTGWNIVTLDREIDGQWEPAHSAVRTPDGDLLDIFGRVDLETALLRSSATRHRVVAVEDMPGDVVTYCDHLRGNPVWWAAENQIIMAAVFSHFARRVLDDNGFPDLAQQTIHQQELATAGTVNETGGGGGSPGQDLGGDYPRSQAAYRAQYGVSRWVDSGYAERLGDASDDAAGRARIDRLAEDLSGLCGSYEVWFEGEPTPDHIGVFLNGAIFDNGHQVGATQWTLSRDESGSLTAHHGLHMVGDQVRIHEFRDAITRQLDRYCAAG